MSQRTWVELDRLNHQVKVHIASTAERMEEAVNSFIPDLIVAPYLKTAIPAAIWKNFTCFIIHPGVVGDRGSTSLDWAILNNEKEWGVTILQATEKMDAGPVWASATFPMRQVPKSLLYRHEVTDAAMKGLLEAVRKFEEKKFVPQGSHEIQVNPKGNWNRSTNKCDFTFSWNDETASIVRKINAADSYPGALCKLLDVEYFCYGVHEEGNLKGSPGNILAQRDDAICVATKDGALWLQCLKEEKDESIKLPSVIALGDHGKNIPVSPIDIFQDNGSAKIFREIKYEESNGVGYLYFDFYNGAMSTGQCRRLQNAFIAAKQRSTKVIVMMGGEDFWSNGIHLNVIENSKDPAQTSWENINAMDDLIHEIICTETHYIISAIAGNAGAGGVSLALAADKVLARRGIVFNPHTRNMGLYGSEYWTYLLPKRIGTQRADLFTEQCLPWGTGIAMEVKLIDDCIPGEKDVSENNVKSFRERVKAVAEELAQLSYFPQLLAAKRFKRKRDENYKPLNKYREDELEKMHRNFFDNDMGYDYKRYCFVHKINTTEKLNGVDSKDLFSERRKIWRRRKYEKIFYER